MLHPPFHPGAGLVVPQLQLEIAGDKIFACHDFAPIDLDRSLAGISHVHPTKRAVDRVEQEGPIDHVMVPRMVENHGRRRLVPPLRRVDDHALAGGAQASAEPTRQAGSGETLPIEAPKRPLRAANARAAEADRGTVAFYVAGEDCYVAARAEPSEIG